MKHDCRGLQKAPWGGQRQIGKVSQQKQNNLGPAPSLQPQGRGEIRVTGEPASAALSPCHYKEFIIIIITFITMGNLIIYWFASFRIWSCKDSDATVLKASGELGQKLNLKLCKNSVKFCEFSPYWTINAICKIQLFLEGENKIQGWTECTPSWTVHICTCVCVCAHVLWEGIGNYISLKHMALLYYGHFVSSVSCLEV